MPRCLARALALEALQSLPACRPASLESGEKILLSVERALDALPWFYRKPLKVLDRILAAACLLPAGRGLAAQSPPERAASLRRLGAFPAFALYRRLVRSLAFLNADYAGSSGARP